MHFRQGTIRLRQGLAEHGRGNMSRREIGLNVKESLELGVDVFAGAESRVRMLIKKIISV